MDEITKCPKCGGEYVYFDGSLYVCPECSYEFHSLEEAAEADAAATEEEAFLNYEDVVNAQ